jgi:CheY-like chemotaxis protein
MLAQEPVDLVILDLLTPGVDGWEVLRHKSDLLKRIARALR